MSGFSTTSVPPVEVWRNIVELNESLRNDMMRDSNFFDFNQDFLLRQSLYISK
jgi:hypothetical protein